MKRICSLIALGLVFVSLSLAQAARPFGSIEYIEGSVQLTRAGKTVSDPNFGDPVYPDDMLRTAADGLVIINLDRSTGMRGELTLRSATTIYLRLEAHASAPRSTIEVISGQIGSKLSRLAGNPSLQVATETAVMGVRGTEFGFVSAATGSVLVYCTEGSVSVTDGASATSQQLVINAGQAAEKKAEERLRLIPVRISDARDFERRWIADEIEAFKANAPRALADFAQRYERLSNEFSQAFEPFQRSEVLVKWLREDATGSTPPSNSPAVLREKRELIGQLNRLRANLFLFERIYYRINQLADHILGTSLEQTTLRPGLTAGEFLRRVRTEAPLLQRRVALVRYAEVLYTMRNEGRSPFSFGSDDFGDNDDFFGSGGF